MFFGSIGEVLGTVGAASCKMSNPVVRGDESVRVSARVVEKVVSQGPIAGESVLEGIPGRAVAPSFLDLLGESRKMAAKLECVDGVLRVRFSEEERTIFEKCRNEAEDRTVLGLLPVKSEGYQALLEWARSNLHESLESVAFVGNGFFEAVFKNRIGAESTLKHSYFYGGREVIFST